MSLLTRQVVWFLAPYGSFHQGFSRGIGNNRSDKVGCMEDVRPTSGRKITSGKHFNKGLCETAVLTSFPKATWSLFECVIILLYIHWRFEPDLNDAPEDPLAQHLIMCSC